MYQPEINARYGTNFNFPVLFYSQLMAIAFGVEGAALNANIIKADKLAAMG
jgi:heterodisulfide reductase subunit B